MLRLRQIRLSVDHSEEELRQAASELLRVRPTELHDLKIEQRAIDARHGRVMLSYTVVVHVEEEQRILQRSGATNRVELVDPNGYRPPYESIERVSKPGAATAGNQHMRPRVLIVGTGPAGLLCGLMLARAGWKPVLLEQGKAAGERARDVTGFWRRGWSMDPWSNVQFGEGGAGTFSDGKLYTQIRDREGRIPWLLRELVAAGAPEDILIKARPHIGTDRLIKVVRHLREEIIALVGEVHFGQRVTDVVVESSHMRAVVLENGQTIEGDRIVFAVGHSARTTFEMLWKSGVVMEPKPFSVGVRIEHPQSQVDRALYGKWVGHTRLGSAPYKFVAHCGTGRAAYSFCMCPGGLVVAAASEAGGVVTNGMSSYAREEANANAGFMVDVGPSDFPMSDRDPLAGMRFQRELEQRAYVLGGENYHAPAQLLGDFLRREPSTAAGSVKPSYMPGVRWSNLWDVLPEVVCETLCAAVPRITESLRCFAMEDAVLTGVETRSSAPVRMTRDEVTLQSLAIQDFYPTGEGAGYAGGIISAAVDGIKVAEAILQRG